MTQKVKKIYILVIVILSLLLLISVIFGIYSFGEYNKRIYNTNLGEDISIKVDGRGNYIGSVSYPNNIVYNTNYKQNINLNFENLTESLVVRGKLIFADNNNSQIPTNLVLTTSNLWLEGEDNYYYFNEIITQNISIDFVKELVIPEMVPSVKNNCVVTIIVEVLTKSQANIIWNSPESWLS